MLLHLDHHVVNVDEFTANRHRFARAVGEDLLEAVVVLNQLRQRALAVKR